MNQYVWLLSVVVAFAPMASFAAASATATDSTSPSTPTASGPCVEVRIGQDRAGHLDCLNELLRAGVDRTASPGHAVDPGSQPPDHVGMPTPAAVKQRLGDTFGRSVQPQRPPQSYAPVLVPKR